MRIVWSAIALVVLGLAITGIPIRYEKVRTVAPDVRNPEFRDLIPAGVSPDIAAAADLAAAMLLFVTVFIGGTLLYFRASHSREATFLSVTLILFGTGFSAITAGHRAIGPPFSQPLLGLLTTIQFFLGTACGLTALFWLPGGRFSSRWAALFTAIAVAIEGVLYFFVSFPRSHDLVNVVGVPAVAVGVWNQLSNFRRVTNPVTRQQIKWAVIGIVVSAAGFMVWQTSTLLLRDQPGLNARIGMIAARLVMTASQMALPVCFAVAISRYRLWHADLMINRSLVYGTVTAVLVLVFVGGGLGLRSVLGRDESSVAFAISTTAAGLLFSPARRHAQRFVDRRLYGFRFDLDELNRAQQLPEVKYPGALTGRTLGRYRLLGVLGRGGMGEVYQGHAGGQLFAIKVLRAELTDTRIRKWFERESQVLAAISHPNIVKFYESGETDGLCYLVLDLIQGRELSDILRERVRIPFDEMGPFLHDFAAALDCAHQRGLVHRDIKPSNIMIRRRADGTGVEAVLMDFGIAKLYDARTALTNTGAVGTISYMAPEQIIAAHTIDHRADIYALGATVYQMLTGELPFKGNPAQVLFAQLHQQPADPRQLVPDLPANVGRGVMRALAKRPEDRFQSVREFADALGWGAAGA